VTAVHERNSKHVRIAEVKTHFTVERSGGAFGIGVSTIGDLTLAHVRVVVERRDGRRAEGWGAILLSWPWAFPGNTTVGGTKDRLMRELVVAYGKSLEGRREFGHPLDHFLAMESELGGIASSVASDLNIIEPVPPLCSLVSLSPVDAAIHDAYGNLHGVNSYDTLASDHLDWDLAHVAGQEFTGRYPADYLRAQPVNRVPIAHTVGAVDPITSDDAIEGTIPPLTDWIDHDAPYAFKVKLKGQDLDWDVERLASVHSIAASKRSRADDIVLYGDLNEQGPSKDYLVEMLDRLEQDHEMVFEALDMLEQPVLRDFSGESPDFHDVSMRVPIVLDEGLTSLAVLDQAYAIGWSGVALKTCKTQSLMLLALPKAMKWGMHISVQDLTNPGIALVHSVGLASRMLVIKPMESNVGQYFPRTSAPEARVFPGIFAVSEGEISTEGINGPGLGYRIEEIDRNEFRGRRLHR
jgi:L-alanine-DL-glutamate epimerase-like enolase superfamily enzyme